MAPAPQSSSSATTSVQVALRIRPTTTQDSGSIPARFQRSVISAVSQTSVSVDATPSTGPVTAAASNSVANAGKKQLFTFDQVHPPATTQHTLFTSTAKPLISRFVEGFNCTILAYGQTSSGKTFTMTGIDLDADPSDSNNGMGIIPRAVSTIFSRCRESKEDRGSSWNYNVKGSFIEIYNEDLIDLLCMEEGEGRREVQIREDKQGHIIWEGLREVPVKSPNEVMNLIRQGTAIRRTNETDMNAQSSRSHAIFSLTLTQRKFTGSGPPPRSSSPLPPGPRPASRIARPGSLLATQAGARVSSPTFSRPTTPSFTSALGRGGRPGSSLGMLSADSGRNNANHADEDQAGDWVTVVSKFHFVDLAGSERLKRTAAAGDRIKEGISINSGLLALGNVISALGDPARAKSHTASYVPYRDSKLTRLLQDSLGGNAHTLMIACVSPTEWNVGETLNTLKYANRARNIKNRAVLNEKEEGWDDIEWLQNTVTRLRKEVKTIKEGGGSTLAITSEPMESTGAGKRVLAQMTELQNNYEDLREKFVERTEELTRLRRDLAEKQRSSKGGHIGGTAKYEEIVGPVIEEYEKTISAMEAELSLNRAALRHTNELYEEKEGEYDVLAERHGAIELYVEELKSRVVKLSEREASNEAYIHDLEEKVKQYDETTVSSSGSITDLKREITKYKDVESSSTQYIADLETRLARADESVLTLRDTVEKLEEECERRREDVRALQERLESLKRDGESWRSDIEERERKVQALEAKMVEWEAKRQQAREERERLGDMVEEVAKARKDAETTIPAKVNGSTETVNTIASASTADGSPEGQLLALRETHTATLADLSSVTVKYRDALREIADLAAQLQEAKVNAPIPPEPSDHVVNLPPTPRRRMTRGAKDSPESPPTNGSARRPFFRQAASVDSLHTRSLSQSVSLSQELSSARSRKASTSSHGSHSSSISYTSSPSHARSRPSLSISLPSANIPLEGRSVLSLEKEIMRLQEVLREREAEISVLEGSLQEKKRSVPKVSPEPAAVNGNGHANGKGDASVESHLSPKTVGQFKALRQSLDGHSLGVSDAQVDENLDRLNELMLSMAQKESSHRETVEDLNDQLSQVRRQFDELTVLSRDQTLNMSTELEALRGVREEDLAKQSDSLKRLDELEHREAELLKQMEQREIEHVESAAEAQLREHDLTESLKESKLREADLAGSLEAVKLHEAELLEALERANTEHASEMEQLRSEHEEAMRAKAAEVDALLARMKEEHEGAVSDTRGQLAEASAALDKAHQDHEAAFGKLKADHEEELRRRSQAVDDMLESTHKGHEDVLAKLTADHQGLLKQREEEAAATLHQTEEEYYNALTKLRADHAQALERQTGEAATALERLRDEHAAEMRMAEMAREGSLSVSQTARESAVKELQEAHATAIATKEKQFTGDLQKLHDEHAGVLSAKEEDYRSGLERIRAEHAATIAKKEAAFAEDLNKLRAEHSHAVSSKDELHRAALDKAASQHSDALCRVKEESAKEIARLTAELEQSRTELTASSSDLQTQMESALLSAKEQQTSALAEAERTHEEHVSRLELSHEAALSAAEDAAEELRASLVRTHAEELARLRIEHHTTISGAQAELVALQEQHHRDLEESRRRAEELFSEEKERLTVALADLETQYAGERETMRKDHALLVSELHQTGEDTVQSMARDHELLAEELEAYKVAQEEMAMAHEDDRHAHQEALQQQADVIGDLQQQLATVHDEREELAAEVAKLRAELSSTQRRTTELVKEASKRESLVEELEKHRSVLAEMQESLQRTKDEMDCLQTEKSRQDSLLRDLQHQMVRSPSPGDPLARGVAYTRGNGMSPTKLPPPTPPPNMALPPAPKVSHDTQLSSASSAAMTITTSFGDAPLDSPSTPATSIAYSLSNGPPSATDPKLTAQVQVQAKRLEEQDVMINTLNKQLMHCESDLQAHIDLVSTLEASLGDSEKNLRKARMQATELARERDNLTSQVTGLRNELHEAKNEVVSVRRSIVEEKQSLESRLDEERRAKERARTQLDNRMEELQRRKSKFACL